MALPRTLRRREVPGTISGLRAGPAVRLASETRLRAQCEHRPLQRFVITQGRRFPGWPRARRWSWGRDLSLPRVFAAAQGLWLAAVFPAFCRAGVHARRTAAIQNRDVRAAAGSGGMRASRPTAAPGGDGQPFWPQRLPWFVGEGHGPPGDIAAAQGPRDDASIVPYRGLQCRRGAVPRLAAGLRRHLPPLSKGGGRAARRGRRDCPAPKCRPGSGRQSQGNPPVPALAPFDKGAFCAAARFHTFSPKPKPRSNAKPVRRAGTVHNFFTKTAKKLFNFFQMYGKVESLEQTNGPGPPAVWTK